AGSGARGHSGGARAVSGASGVASLLSLRRGLVEARAQTVTIARGVCRELGEPLPGGMAKQFVANIRNVTLRPEAARSTRCVPDRGIEQRAALSLAGSTARIGR